MFFHQLSGRAFFIGIFLLPLIFVPTIENGFEGPKVWFLWGWVIVLSISTAIYVLREETRSFNKILPFLVFSYFFWCFLTSFFGVDPPTSFYGLFWRGQGLVTLACFVALVWVIVSVFEKKDQKILAKVLVSSGFALCLFVLISIASNYFWYWPIYKYLERHPGTMGNPNFLGGYLAIVLPLIFVVKNNLLRIILISTFLMVIYLTESRGSWLALGLTLTFFALLNSFRQSRQIKAIVAFAVIVGFLVWFFPWISRIPWTDPNFAASRQRIWMRGMLAVKERPFLGFGLENYAMAVAKINYPIKLGIEPYVDKAHNEILEILVASGIPGLFLWLMIFGFAARKYYSRKNYLFLAALLIFFVKAQTNVVSVSEYVLFWTLVAFSVI